MSEHDPLKTLLLEMALAVGMIACLVGAMFIHTGSMPPLVVVESKSMIHEEGGELGSIDAGDLILVHDQPGDTIVTYAEATDPDNTAYGYQQHGLEGDVIIYAKNGEGGTPIIHRAIMRVVAEETVLPDRTATTPCPEEATYDAERTAEDGLPGSCILTWSVPGTSVKDVSNVTVRFDGTDAAYYDCERPAHAGVEAHLVVWQWEPEHEGMLTLGDNNKCSVDQGAGATNGSAGVHSPSGVVGPVRDSWVLGVAGGEIPWLGTVKLMVGGPDSYGTRDVPSSSFIALFAVLGAVLLLPQVSEQTFRWWLNRSPELTELAKRELDQEAS
ncbi:MAG TPA: S26 family signal peptidase [Candidatus Poseidoniales archaeon]|nr:MAG TPA: S26 family signal peptidase [Candidatus Poseidoniales archaeon]|tara:strand:+ start:3391 stop:4374 length:984 start_codon:yes stop_codon:yes gene_type:complete